MSEWQPMEAAPRDGASILLFEYCGLDDELDASPQTHIYVVAHWSEPESGWVADNSTEVDLDGYYTHWMPLPEPPDA